MVYADFSEEEILWSNVLGLVAGVDEVGRGCFAGPVVVASVIFPPFVSIPFQLADSKLLTPKKREDLAKRIEEFAKLFCIKELGVS